MIRRVARCGVVVGLVALTSQACGGSPASPSTFPATQAGASFQLTAPIPSSPAQGAEVPSWGTFVLTAANAAKTSASPDVILLTFEISSDAAFSSGGIVLTQTLPQETDGTTSSGVFFNYRSDWIGRTLYWRVRADAGDAAAVESQVRSMVLGPRTDGVVSGSADRPTIVSPLPSSTQPRTVTFTVRNAVHSPGTTAYHIEASRDPAFPEFTGQLYPCWAFERPALTESFCDLTLPPGHYYLRAQTVTIGLGANSLSEGYHSAYTPTSSFDVAPQVINAPAQVSPDYYEVLSGRPTFVVRNATRSGTTGPLAYRFEIFIGYSGFGEELVASGTAPEDPSGQTAWTLPFDLALGFTYTWRARAIETSSGLSGERSYGVPFVMVSRNNALVTLSIEGNKTGVCPPPSVNFAASTSEGLAAPALSIRTSDQMSIVLAAGASGTLTGTIGGRQGGYAIAGPGSNPRATTTARLNPDGSITGTFDGRIFYTSGLDHECAVSGFGWTVRPR